MRAAILRSLCQPGFLSVPATVGRLVGTTLAVTGAYFRGGVPTHDPALSPLSMLLVDGTNVAAALDVLTKTIEHAGATFLASGLSTVVTDAAGHVLHLLSRGDNSTISKEVRVDVRRVPILTWRWKMVTLPAGGDCRRKAVDDEAGQVYVAFPRFPTSVRSRIIGYVWDTTAPAGTIVQSESSSLVTYVVVRSGAADAGRWLTETRNVYEDYKRIYGEAPTETAGAVSVAIDSNDTRTSAESYLGTILFRAP